MYCRKLKSGKWSCTTDATPCPLTGKRRQVTRNGDTKREAMNRAQLASEKLMNSRSVENKRVSEVYRMWMDVYSEVVKESSVVVRRKTLKPFIDKHGEHFIRNLQSSDIQDFLFEERNKGLAENTLSMRKASLNLLFKFAMKNDYVEKNIVEGSVIPKPLEKENENKFEEPARRYLEENEVPQFLKIVNANSYRNAYVIAVLMLSTGLRIGEALALEWSDVDLENHVLRVNKTLYERSGMDGEQFEFSTPKTGQSARTISFNDNLAEVLRKHKVRYNKEKLVGLRDPESKWKDLIFVSNDMTPLWASNVGVAYRRAYKMMGINIKSTTHALRHTHITMLVQAGVDFPVIMERVGHTNMNTTMEIYTHVTKKMKEKSDEQFNDYFSQFI